MDELKPCKCGGAVRIAYACGEHFIVCENDCMDIPACFHTDEKLTAKEWNEWRSYNCEGWLDKKDCYVPVFTSREEAVTAKEDNE